MDTIIAHKNETSEVYNFKVHQKWGTPPYYITAKFG